MKVQLFSKIRIPQKSDELSFLIEQIRKDCLIVQKYWGITACFRFFIDIRKHQVKLCNHKIILSAKEFDVLYLSYSNLDVAFMIKQIYEVVWHDSANGIYHAVKNTVF